MTQNTCAVHAFLGSEYQVINHTADPYSGDKITQANNTTRAYK
jgi:hypothetical protein